METQKKKPGPKPKPKPNPNPIVYPQSVPFQAVESTELPLTGIEVKRVRVHKLIVGVSEYFIQSEKKKVYTCVNGKPGVFCGYWNSELQVIDDIEESMEE